MVWTIAGGTSLPRVFWVETSPSSLTSSPTDHPCMTMILVVQAIGFSPISPLRDSSAAPLASMWQSAARLTRFTHVTSLRSDRPMILSICRGSLPCLRRELRSWVGPLMNLKETCSVRVSKRMAGGPPDTQPVVSTEPSLLLERTRSISDATFGTFRLMQAILWRFGTELWRALLTLPTNILMPCTLAYPTPGAAR